MTIEILSRFAIAVPLLMVIASPSASTGQAVRPSVVTSFLGTWIGDKQANDKAFQQGLLPAEHGLRISTTADTLVVVTTFRRSPIAPDTPWIDGEKSSYSLAGSTSSDTLIGWRATNKLATDGDALILTIVEAPRGPARAQDAPLASPVNILQTMKMSIVGADRLRLEWTRGRFPASLFYDRQK